MDIQQNTNTTEWVSWERMERHMNECPKEKMEAFYEDAVMKLIDCHSCKITWLEVKENKLTKVLYFLGLDGLLDRYCRWKMSKVYQQYGFEPIEWKRIERPPE